MSISEIISIIFGALFIFIGLSFIIKVFRKDKQEEL